MCCYSHACARHCVHRTASACVLHAHTCEQCSARRLCTLVCACATAAALAEHGSLLTTARVQARACTQWLCNTGSTCTACKHAQACVHNTCVSLHARHECASVQMRVQGVQQQQHGWCIAACLHALARGLCVCVCVYEGGCATGVQHSSACQAHTRFCVHACMHCVCLHTCVLMCVCTMHACACVTHVCMSVSLCAHACATPAAIAEPGCSFPPACTLHVSTLMRVCMCICITHVCMRVYTCVCSQVCVQRLSSTNSSGRARELPAACSHTPAARVFAHACARTPACVCTHMDACNVCIQVRVLTHACATAEQHPQQSGPNCFTLRSHSCALTMA